MKRFLKKYKIIWSNQWKSREMPRIHWNIVENPDSSSNVLEHDKILFAALPKNLQKRTYLITKEIVEIRLKSQ